MLETICRESETKVVKEEIEISRRFGWFDLPRDGGGDIDSADFPLDYQPNPRKLDYDKLT